MNITFSIRAAGASPGVYRLCQVVLDLTFGGGGHSKVILRSVPGVILVAVDRDPEAFRLAKQLAEEYPLWEAQGSSGICTPETQDSNRLAS
ncbi:hypothetical protein NFI96_009889 [Prochilodus magdalenae]|nr:hypothetical protein NFI96_009889 [Prochilodus magdalenae]